MFQFEKGRMYQMPVHFGPCCGPRQGPDGQRFIMDGPQESTQHTLVYETDPVVVERYLPDGFTLRSPHVIVTHKMHRNLPWLAGRGYNVTTFNVPVTYVGREETVHGQYQLAIWENHADPILCGREQLGYAKVFADIEDMHTLRGIASTSLFSWEFRFLELRFDTAAPPEDPGALRSVLFDPDNEGLLHYKYIPHTGDGFSSADTAYVTLTPKAFPIPSDAAPLPPPDRSYCSGSLIWHLPSWEDMPTQYHIVQGLAAMPILRILGASIVHMQHYNDVFHQRAVR